MTSFEWWWLIPVVGYVGLLVSSGYLVDILIKYAMDVGGYEKLKEGSTWDSGKVIGKCENLIILTFILLEAFTGLALIFAAKGLIRKSEDSNPDKSSYYLIGTLVNFTYSTMVGVVMLLLISHYS